MTTDDPALRALIERVRGARADRTALDIRGGGSKAFYGEAARGEAFDVTALRGISSYEPTELVVSARCGTPLAELEAVLAEKGQCPPFEPPHFDVTGPLDACGVAPRGGAQSAWDGPAPTGTTVGGMVATGLSGPARAAVGSVRDFVLGATMLNGRGELLSFGGQVMKNVAGYDVSRALVGSMGVLGVICEVSLKVLPAPRATATLRFELDEASAIRQLNTWAGKPLPLGASAWWNGMLVLRLQGAAAAVSSAATELGGECIEAAQASAFWNGLRDQTDEYFAAAERAVAVGSGTALWRLAVPQTAAPLALPGDTLIEWGGAQRWLCSKEPARVVREAAARAGGHATLFRALDKSAGVFAPLSVPLARLHRELKRAFDPDGVLNPGRLYPDL